MKTRKKILHFSSGDLATTFPKSWEDLDQAQLLYIYKLLAADFSPEEVRVYAWIRFNNLEVAGKDDNAWVVLHHGRRYRLGVATVAFGLMDFTWLEEPPTTPVRLHSVGNTHATAIDAALHGLPFRLYIQIENLYQGYLMSKDEEALRELAKILYPGVSGEDLSAAELLNVMAWVTGVKNLFARLWPEFFQPASSSPAGETDMVAIMNAEIRALTGGDITKEKEVLDTDCWRCLTELNEKTREARQLQKSLKK